MASNARQLKKPIVNYQQANPAVNNKVRIDPDGYQSAIFSRREKTLIAKFVVGILCSMLVLVTISNRVTSLDRRLSQSQDKTDQLKVENNKITEEINQTTSLKRLEKTAKDSQMNRSNDNIKNIN